MACLREGFSTKAVPGEARRGLGLALVRQLVYRRGGHVTVENDGGAVFTAHLPARMHAPTDPVAEVTA